MWTSVDLFLKLMKRSNLWKCLFNFKKYFSYSMLDTWHAAVHGVAKSQTQLGNLTTAKVNARYHWKQLIFLLLLKRLPQSYMTLCHPMDCNPPGSSVYGIFQARILEWAAISFSRGSSQPRDRTRVSCIGRWILYQWVTREARKIQYQLWKVWNNRLKCIDCDSLAVNSHWANEKKERFLT